MKTAGSKCDACVQHGELVSCLKCELWVHEDAIDGKGRCEACRRVPRHSCCEEGCANKVFALGERCDQHDSESSSSSVLNVCIHCGEELSDAEAEYCDSECEANYNGDNE